MTAGCSDLERLGAFALLVNVDGLTWLHAEAWAVYTLAIDQDVTVDNHLTCLRNGAGEACTKHKCI
jgi:hypothetical protein